MSDFDPAVDEPRTAAEEQQRVAYELDQLDYPPSRDEYDRIMGW